MAITAQHEQRGGSSAVACNNQRPGPVPDTRTVRGARNATLRARLSARPCHVLRRTHDVYGCTPFRILAGPGGHHWARQCAPVFVMEQDSQGQVPHCALTPSYTQSTLSCCGSIYPSVWYSRSHRHVLSNPNKPARAPGPPLPSPHPSSRSPPQAGTMAVGAPSVPLLPPFSRLPLSNPHPRVPAPPTHTPVPQLPSAATAAPAAPAPATTPRHAAPRPSSGYRK